MIYQDITVIIASFHSRDKIFDCINSISKDVKIIVVENSNDQVLKESILTKYKNVECILSLIKKKKINSIILNYDERSDNFFKCISN